MTRSPIKDGPSSRGSSPDVLTRQKSRAGELAWDAAAMAKRPSRDGRRSDGGPGWFLAGYAGIAGFLALEALTRRPGRAASLETSADDQGTTRMIVVAYGVAAELPLLLRRVPAPRLPAAAAPAGAALVAGHRPGVAALWWPALLGRAYPRRIDAEEQLLNRDLPGYAAYQERTKKLVPHALVSFSGGSRPSLPGTCGRCRSPDEH